MSHDNPDLTFRHLTNEELLQASDGELSSDRMAEVQAHLAACWTCRSRKSEMDGAIADFARAYHQKFDPQIPPTEGPRAMLRARLGALASDTPSPGWTRILQVRSPVFAAVSVCAIVVATVWIMQIVAHRSASPAATVAIGIRSLPDSRLTPGDTRGISMTDVCSTNHEEVIADVSPALRQQVLHEYDIADAAPGDYEIDYLIAPGLGGTDDLRNLWPQPYGSGAWNAHVKDDLEERLHQMVCDGQLDLSTAQREIATNWIAAYKKYFHTDQPIALHSRLAANPLDPNRLQSTAVFGPQ
jgi:hypothetical protein